MSHLTDCLSIFFLLRLITKSSWIVVGEEIRKKDYKWNRKCKTCIDVQAMKPFVFMSMFTLPAGHKLNVI